MKEQRIKTESELRQNLDELFEQQFRLRMKKSSNNEFKQTHLFKHNRLDIARIKTLIREKNILEKGDKNHESEQ